MMTTLSNKDLLQLTCIAAEEKKKAKEYLEKRRRRSQDFLWGCTFFIKKLTTFLVDLS